MAAQGTPSRGIETAIYVVGGLGLGLLGVRDLVVTAVNMYGTTYHARLSDISAPTWAGWAGDLVVAFLFLGTGLYLLFRGRQTRWRGMSPVPAAPSSAQ